MSLPPISLHNIPPALVPQRVHSDHIEFNSGDISLLGLKPSSTWALQTEELASRDQAKRVMWVRHAQGIHNAAELALGKDEWESVECRKDVYFDANLNEIGVEQSKVLQFALNGPLTTRALKVDLIIVSPLSRAIETAQIAFESVWDQVPVIAVELARERFGKNICDKRRSVSELKRLFPRVDFDSFMDGEHDSYHDAEVRETPEQVAERVKRLMHWIMQLPYDSVAVVGHSDYMSHASVVAGFPHHWPANCELVPMMLRNSNE
ncbi:hypothetical protein BASA81_013750 [Batrachochytrium salamandrivorans]|nr:hypothetical protein BASA81_013750 [Batrachochytrium salamandrivorans]